MVGRIAERMLTIGAGLALCLSGAVSGQTIPSKPVQGVAPLDACSLATPDEISGVAGVKVGAGERNDAGLTPDGAYSSTCVWKIAGDRVAPADSNAPFGGARFVILNAMAWPAGAGAAEKYLDGFRDAAKSNLIDMTPTPVQAGDDALWWGDGVAVRKGDVSFGVSAHVGGDKAAERAMEETLARKIASRL